MASNKNITMRQFNGTDYDYLYPKTTTGQVSGLSDNYYSKSESNGLYLKTDGSNAMTGNLNVGNHYLSNVANPASPQDGATKQYVDSAIAANTVYTVNIGYNGNISSTTLTSGQSVMLVGSASFNANNAIAIIFSCSINTTMSWARDGSHTCYISGAGGGQLGYIWSVNAPRTESGLVAGSVILSPPGVEINYSNNKREYSFWGASFSSTVPVNYFALKASYSSYYNDGSMTLAAGGWCRIDVVYRR